MAARHDPGTKLETKLARRRVAADIAQLDMAIKVGISLPTYRRLERNKMRNPPFRYLVNCAIELGCHWSELVEAEWEQRKDFHQPG
jgi:transcriptional regulator with XRE-family HTH domain